MRKLLQDVFPALFLLQFVHSGRDQGDEATPPHARPARYDCGREGRAVVVNKLARGVERFAAVAQQARGVGLRVEIKKEGPEDDSQTAVEHVKTVL